MQHPDRQNFAQEEGDKCEYNSKVNSSISDTHDNTIFSPYAAKYQDDHDRKNKELIVHNLARQYTCRSGQTGVNPFLDTDENSPTNPASSNFSARAWAKALVELDTSGFRNTGFCFQNLSVYGYGTITDYQKDVANTWLGLANLSRSIFGVKNRQRVDILNSFDGVVRKGEMLVVLGPPGSGCSTLLKSIAGDMGGIDVGKHTYLNYQGISAKEMHTEHKGDAIYTAEVDVHFPTLTVGDTLTFAACARAPRNFPAGVDRTTYTSHLRDVTMAMFGISHTTNTRVGNDFVRGVSGGERKRVTISEAALCGAPLQCWDNSTRGLDSANAVEFCKTIRVQTEMFGTTACVSMYQSPQSAYDLFDKVTLLYDGYQIFFGPTAEARSYFEKLGFLCLDGQTTPDFLTSMTNPSERVVRSGFEEASPRTPEEFNAAWRASPEFRDLQKHITAFQNEFPLEGHSAEIYRAHKRSEQAKFQRLRSPFIISYTQQVRLCLWRGIQRLRGDPSVIIGAVIGNTAVALIVASVFYNLQMTTDSFYQRGALIFFACLTNAFSSSLEISTLYAQRPIVEKQSRYAMYHPSAEAISSMICDLPYKILNTVCYNTVIYFMSNLKRDPSAFFFFLLISLSMVLAMSMIFRTIGAVSRTMSQAMVPAAILILALIIFTGFVIPVDYMLDWCRWIKYVNPLAYGFEALMVNEFHNRKYICSQYVPDPAVPGYSTLPTASRVCATVGSKAGVTFVLGDDYIMSLFRYDYAHRWRNLGILCAFIIGFMLTYIATAEVITAKKSNGEVLIFRRGFKPTLYKNKQIAEAEDGQLSLRPIVKKPGVEGHDGSPSTKVISTQSDTGTFHWKDVCYDVKVKGNTSRILDHVAGWVKPGKLTALMGVSGAGKTTLLDALADRLKVGDVSGEILVDGRPRDASFQRNTGYVQQQDLHLATTTVREALSFSALLRQPANIPRAKKLAYVDKVLQMLDMEEYADAVVGIPGEGLNVEQRKRLTIGVELAAKPPLLLFVDEPTSGLDSQTSWAILDLLRKLADTGQAILCTIHQPSTVLLQRFDRLLLLAQGGKTVYFGNVGTEMTSYFERNGAASCPQNANPAEWMLEVIGAAPGSHSEVNWVETWINSSEYQRVQAEIQLFRDQSTAARRENDSSGNYQEFAADFTTQLKLVTHRAFQQYWRTPHYIYSKATLCLFVALFIGFIFFDAPNTIQGLQNQMFAIFNILTVFGQLVLQTMPLFVTQRGLYEARERLSKIYDWKVFMLAQIVVELPWNSLMAVVMFVGWYYPIGLHRNAIAAGQQTERGALMFLLLWVFMIFTSTFTDMIIAGFDTAEAGGNVANMLFMLLLVFCGVLATPDKLPAFWLFMYYMSPFTYLLSAMLSTAVANIQVHCASNEYLHLDPPPGQTCGQFLGPYVELAGGYLLSDTANSTASCLYCNIKEANVFLESFKANYFDRWRNFGILLIFIIFNVLGALFVYWLTRVPKTRQRQKSHQTMQYRA